MQTIIFFIDFINFAKANPSSAALLVKDWILRGAEPKPDLLDKIKTGARVNAFQTVLKAAQYCGACAQPAQVKVATTTTSAKATMTFLSPSQFRKCAARKSYR